MNNKKIALVTGANKGLGFETSRQLAEQGITVLMGARNAGKGKAAVKKLKDAGLSVEFILLDVTNHAHIRDAAEEIKKRFGKLDILANNAGMSHKEETMMGNSTATISSKALREIFDTNFSGHSIPACLCQSTSQLKKAGYRITSFNTIGPCHGSIMAICIAENQFFDPKRWVAS